MEILYWHWIVFGIGLVLLELMIPSFTALWFGLGAVSVGLILIMMPSLTLTIQITMWALISAFLTTLWFKFLKPDLKHGGQVVLSDVEGEKGLVIIKPLASRCGKVRFSTPLLGVDEWEFQTEGEVEIGDQIQVVDVKNNILIMRKN